MRIRRISEGSRLATRPRAPRRATPEISSSRVREPPGRGRPCRGSGIFQAVGFFGVESCPTQAVLPLVGLAAEKVIRDR
ncbi:MAG: hypothetical protein ACQESR_11520, partial [Planctomycetota bacterium]